ncbi:hypothetical protein PFMG_02066 [Plasmodium falciparum IGH-CR14]|uniref:Uncharacterized protein n=1 Tax=Plasmodium falciparum IGH-CR14 TaxID=580059 RepID=A0A0L1IA67_PLAFA|nr:hypothetical protein PFMG_02066 [Plasmodium falciparum IGH-CR14]
MTSIKNVTGVRHNVFRLNAHKSKYRNEKGESKKYDLTGPQKIVPLYTLLNRMENNFSFLMPSKEISKAPNVFKLFGFQNIKNIHKIKEGFRKLDENTEKENYLDTKFGLMLKYNINKTYGMQRVKKGEHNSWGMKKGVFRSRKT